MIPLIQSWTTYKISLLLWDKFKINFSYLLKVLKVKKLQMHLNNLIVGTFTHENSLKKAFNWMLILVVKFPTYDYEYLFKLFHIQLKRQ
jgi:hypothetical protein